MIDTNEISKRAKLFRNIDPKVYEQMLRFLDAYVQELTDAAVDAPPDQVLNAQGRAQQGRKFLRLFTELPEDTA